MTFLAYLLGTDRNATQITDWNTISLRLQSLLWNIWRQLIPVIIRHVFRGKIVYFGISVYTDSPALKQWQSDFFFSSFFRAAPMAYGGFQAKGRIGATAAGWHHSSQHRGIPNPLGEARDWIRNPTALSQIRFRCTTLGTPATRFWTPRFSSKQVVSIVKSRPLDIRTQSSFPKSPRP